MKKAAFAISLCLLLNACGGGGGEGTSAQATTEPNHQFKDPSGQLPGPITITADFYNWIKNNAVPFRSNQTAAGDDFADLEKFGQMVGDQRIVSLSEFSHGDANSFALLNRLVQYLHQKKGFEVLVMESAMFDVEAIWRSSVTKNASVADLAPGRIFYMYSKNDSAREVLHYIDRQKTSQRPLILEGLDEPAGGDASIKELVPALKTFLSNRGSTIPQQSNWNDFANVAQSAIELSVVATTNTTTFKSVANQIRGEICEDNTMGTTPRNTPSWWCLQVGGLLAAAERQDYIARNKIDPEKDPREEQMAQNLLWLATQQYPTKKIIIWSNSVHGTKLYQNACVLNNEKCIKGVNDQAIPMSMLAKAAPTLGTQLHTVTNFPNGGIMADYITGAESSVSKVNFDFALVLSDLGNKRYYLNNKPDQVSQLKVNFTTNHVVDSIFHPLTGMDTLFYYEGSLPAKVSNYPTLPLP